MRRISAVLLEIVLLLALLSCSTVTPHENFKNHMMLSVDKKNDDPSSYLSRYPKSVFGSKTLPNGNTETEFRHSSNCKVFFEIDPKTRIVLNFRFEGKQRDCIIVP